jgi:hypothetical protein
VSVALVNQYGIRMRRLYDLEFCREIFRKILKYTYNLMEIRPGEDEVSHAEGQTQGQRQADRQTDRQTERQTNKTRLKVVFRNFATAPENVVFT